MNAPRNFAVELQAARDAQDWAAHERIWEERRHADVAADEAMLLDPSQDCVFLHALVERLGGYCKICARYRDAGRCTFDPFSKEDPCLYCKVALGEKSGFPATLVTATGKSYSQETRDWTKVVTMEFKNRAEAINWVRFNRDWMKDLRIDGVPA